MVTTGAIYKQLQSNQETVCMFFFKSKRFFARQLPNFTPNDKESLELVQEFKYLGHMLSNRLLDDY